MYFISCACTSITCSKYSNVRLLLCYIYDIKSRKSFIIQCFFSPTSFLGQSLPSLVVAVSPSSRFLARVHWISFSLALNSFAFSHSSTKIIRLRSIHSEIKKKKEKQCLIVFVHELWALGRPTHSASGGNIVPCTDVGLSDRQFNTASKYTHTLARSSNWYVYCHVNTNCL